MWYTVIVSMYCYIWVQSVSTNTEQSVDQSGLYWKTMTEIILLALQKQERNDNPTKREAGVEGAEHAWKMLKVIVQGVL